MVYRLLSLGAEDFQTVWSLLNGILDSKPMSFDSYILISQYSHGDHKFPHEAKAIRDADLYGLEIMLDSLLKADSASRTWQS